MQNFFSCKTKQTGSSLLVTTISSLGRFLACEFFITLQKGRGYVSDVESMRCLQCNKSHNINVTINSIKSISMVMNSLNLNLSADPGNFCSVCLF